MCFSAFFFFLLFTCVASCELLPSLLLPGPAGQEDSRGSFFFSVTEAQKHGYGQGETICFVHVMYCFINALTEGAQDGTSELIWQSPCVQTAAEAQKASHSWSESFSDSSRAGVMRDTSDSQPRALPIPPGSPTELCFESQILLKIQL